MNHIEYCNYIGLPHQAIDCINHLTIDDDEYIRYQKLFHRNTALFISEILSKRNWKQLFLYYYTRFSSEVIDQYRQRGISEQICWDTFHDQIIWYNNCVSEYGEPGLAEYDWLWWSIKGLLFRIGRLQFAPLALHTNIVTDTIALPAGSLVLNTHIPQGEPLLVDRAEESFCQALCFFRGINPIFYCHSWLLSPSLLKLLPQESNIVKFQKLFSIIETDNDDTEAIYRIFNRRDRYISQFPEETTLQKNAKRYLIDGGRIGIGIGLRFQP